MLNAVNIEEGIYITYEEDDNAKENIEASIDEVY